MLPRAKIFGSHKTSTSVQPPLREKETPLACVSLPSSQNPPSTQTAIEALSKNVSLHGPLSERSPPRLQNTPPLLTLPDGRKSSLLLLNHLSLAASPSIPLDRHLKLFGLLKNSSPIILFGCQPSLAAREMAPSHQPPFSFFLFFCQASIGSSKAHLNLQQPIRE